MKTRTLTTAVVAAGAAVTVVTTLSAAPDARAPRIVSAAMQDADGDSRADRMRLTYSERVRHAADRDGKYPFARRRLQGARGRDGEPHTIVLSLVEKAAVDRSAQPAVRLPARRRPGRRRRRANQAVGAVLPRRRVPSGTAGGTGRPDPAPAAAAAAGHRAADPTATGRDEQDCGPTDPATNRARPTCPTSRFVDSNCDGSTAPRRRRSSPRRTGKDTNPGTRSGADAHDRDGRLAAAATGKTCSRLVRRRTSASRRDGSGIYGGYDPKGRGRNAAFAKTTRRHRGEPEAVSPTRRPALSSSRDRQGSRPVGSASATTSTASAPSTARS